jgi:hypothetical protein
MSRRRRRRTAATGAGPRHGGPGAGWTPGPRTRRIAWVAIAVVVVAAGAWFIGHRSGHAPTATHGPEPVNEAIATLDPETVVGTADSLGRAGRHLASLPYYRQALRNTRTDFWQLHFNYGTALYNATLEIDARNGVPVHAVRSSWERVACMREAVQEILAAERLARTPRDLALVRSTRARMLWLWGLPWETFAAYREAQFADPADRALVLQADRYMDLLRSPATSGLAESGAPVPAAPEGR